MNRTTTPGLRGKRFFSVITDLREDITDMLKREFTLLKAELSQKASCVGRQGAFIAAGGVVALIGAIFLLIGVCGFIAFGLTKAGLSPLSAFGTAFAGFGAIVGVAGYFVLKKGIAALKATSLAPEQTLNTVKEFAHPETHPINVKFPKEGADEANVKIDHARASAEHKIQEVQREAAELRARLTPKYMWAATCTAVNRRPQLSAGIGASILALGVMMIRRRHRRHELVIG